MDHDYGGFKFEFKYHVAPQNTGLGSNIYRKIVYFNENSLYDEKNVNH